MTRSNLVTTFTRKMIEIKLSKTKKGADTSIYATNLCPTNGINLTIGVQ
jgi:hypothetical protein